MQYRVNTLYAPKPSADRVKRVRIRRSYPRGHGESDMSKQVFAMFDVNNRARVQKRLEESFPDDFLPVGSQAFLVADAALPPANWRIA